MTIDEKVKKSRTIWDECADSYEEQIVSGHPDIVGLEAFEEDYIDALLRFLIDRDTYPISLMDIGCGSGRLHLRYLIKTAKALHSDSGLANLISNMTKNASNLKYDPIIAKGLSEVWGIDFSSRMLALAKEKMVVKSTLQNPLKCTFVEGSAFEIAPADKGSLPVSVCLINTIGIMQSPELVFKAMRRQVEAAGGIACIFCYKKESVKAYGLSNYESTLDVSGQPKWLIPADYAGNKYKMIARKYKLAHSTDPELMVDVFNTNMEPVEKNFLLKRDPAIVDMTLQSGHIQTYSGYESHWYSFNRVETWINKFWQGRGTTYHLDAKTLDSVRAEPEQIAIFDPENHLDGFIQRGQ